MLRLVLSCLTLLLLASSSARAASEPGLDRLGAIAIQDGGRTMPLQTYAGRLAVQLTGRMHWSASSGPEGFADRKPMQLLCDLMFNGREFLNKRMIAIENRPFKRAVGLEAERRFFSPTEIAANKGINDLLQALGKAREADPQVPPTRDQRRALDVRNAVERVAVFASGERLAIIPAAPGKPFLSAGPAAGDPGTEQVQAALAALGKSYIAGDSLDTPVAQVITAIDAMGHLSPSEARALSLEVFYDRNDPWMTTAFLYGLALLLFGISRLMLRRPLTILAVIAAAGGVAAHFLGIGLRVAILGRAPVSNTYEALLWMGLVAIAVAVIAQIINRRAWYLAAGLAAALISVIFAGMVPLEDRTNSLPAVLRSNFWLTIHVLTIVASYGVLAVASVLGHVYLGKEVLFAKRGTLAQASSKRSAALIIQTYRTIQIGLFLLTAGTILGGVWAAESWGRFWGWDPKETWALISIVVYFAVLHARYIQWLKDFGLAAAAVLGFVVIVWTFYGVNYVMATGLHSYGFGSGGEVYVGIWAAAEIAFLIACRVRYDRKRPAMAPASSVPTINRPAHPPAHTPA